MRLRKYICAFAALLVLMSGCTGGKESEPGRVEQMTVAQLQEKITKEEDLAVVITQVDCKHCKTFMQMLEEYLPNHNLVLYDIVLDAESDRNTAIEQLNEIFPDFTGTPDVYYIEKGKVKSRFWDENESLSEKSFDKWLDTYELFGKFQ